MALTVLLGAMAPAEPALAQRPAAAVSPMSTGGALQRHFNDGVAAANNGDWPKAYDCFRAAWTMEKQYQIGAQLARAELHLGKHRDAAEHLSHVLHTAKNLSAKGRVLLEQMLTEAKTKIATLVVMIDRDGVEVFVDGAMAFVSPLSREIYVEPGPRTIEARVPGEPAQRMRLTLREGESRELALPFEQGPAVDASRSAGQPPAMSPYEDASQGPDRLLVGAGAGVGAIAIGVGTVTTMLSFSKARERDDACGTSAPARCGEPAWNAFESSRTTLANVAVASFIGGGIVLGGTLVYALQPPRMTRSQTVTLRVRRDGPALVLSGTW